MHSHFVEIHQIRTQKTPTSIPVNTVQNTKFKGGPITKFAKLKLQVLDKGGGMHTESTRFYVAKIGKEDIILGTKQLLEHNLEVDWHAYRLHFTRCLPSCQIKERPVKAKRATRKSGCPNTSIWYMVTVLQKSKYSILMQKPGKALPGQKVGNTIVPLL